LDLIEAWKADKTKRNKSHLFLENRESLLNANLDDTDFILGNYTSTILKERGIEQILLRDIQDYSR
jgi:hypothetical protein